MPAAWSFRIGEQFAFPTRAGAAQVLYQIAAHGVLDRVRTYLLVTVEQAPVAMRIENEERLLAIRDRDPNGRLTASGGVAGQAMGADADDPRSNNTMRTFVFLAEPTSPQTADVAPASGQMLGIAAGIDQSHAFLQLVRANQSLLATDLDEVVCLELVGEEPRYLYLHDLRPADGDTEAHAMFKKHLLTGEPLGVDEVAAVVSEGYAQKSDFEDRGGSCHWFAPAFPDDGEG
ncbi:MAG: hypothetical protein ABFE07_17810 [Armatimonadia bacterium]